MTHLIAIDDLHRATQQCIQRVGLSSANARDAGLALFTPAAMVVFKHGTTLPAGYLQ